jgi:hypothetical protein
LVAGYSTAKKSGRACAPPLFDFRSICFTGS